MKNWIEEAIFYHIYPLGFCDAPRFNEKEITHRITKLKDWIPHIQKMGFNAVYLGPLFESYEHGYDTSDYRMIDHRLGDHGDVKALCSAFHDADIQIVFDGVFNHVGREFWAFKDVIENREASRYCNWFSNLRFDQNNPMNDGFTYDTWQGYYNLVKLNLRNEDVITYLLDSVGMWMDEFGLDGLRLDAADCIDVNFFKRLKNYCKEKKPSFWLMGEIIHGDYTRWANADMLDSVTNYECYKGLYSSHNDKNYFEIAHSLNRQFAKGGIYESLHLYNFVDNHDVNRIASTVSDQRDLLNIYTLLYTMPGIPSVYYGSEWEIEGKKHDGSDADIRPCINLTSMIPTPLTSHIQKLCEIRKSQPVLYYGTHTSITIKNEQFVFARALNNEVLYIALNVSEEPQTITLKEDGLKDLLNGNVYLPEDHIVSIPIPAKRSCILTCEHSIPIPEEPKLAPEVKSKTSKENTSKPMVANRKAPLKLGLYEHFKGNHYSVLYIATHSEDLEPYVVYRQLYGDESVWVRPLTMFLEEVEVDGNIKPRFKYIGK